MSQKDNSSFKEKLEATHQFPCQYTFKFIVKEKQVDEVSKLVEGADIQIRHSKNKNYVSVTLIAQMPSSDAVIKMYEKSHHIEGIIAL